MSNIYLFREQAHEISKLRNLKFIHITKTAGTSLEKSAKRENIHWGKFHEELKATCLKAKSWWHCPLSSHSKKLQEKYDWFLVCRNPYERIISEFHCKWGGVGKKSKYFTITMFNLYVIFKILRFQHLERVFNVFQPHYQKQSLYLEGPARKFIIRFEFLDSDLKKLAGLYADVEKILPLKKLNVNQKKFTTKNFWALTIYLIRIIYKNDFNNFGYSTEANTPKLKV